MQLEKQSTLTKIFGIPYLSNQMQEINLSNFII